MLCLVFRGSEWKGGGDRRFDRRREGGRFKIFVGFFVISGINGRGW